jgi:hypothetical protein
VTAGPLHLATKVHSPMGWIPFRVPHCLPAVRRASRTDSPELPVPSTTSPGQPRMRRVVRSRLGSALRLSQPLSGFLAHPSFAALLHAAAVPGIPPFRVFPSQESRTPLGATCSPAVIHRRAEARRPGSCHRQFRRLPRCQTQLPGSPGDYGFPFHTPEGALPGPPGPRTTEPPRSARFTDFEALILLRVRSHRAELPRTGGRSSPGFLPL